MQWIAQDAHPDWLTSPAAQPCWLAARSTVHLGDSPVTFPNLPPALQRFQEQVQPAPLAVEQFVLGRGDAQGRLVVRVTAPAGSLEPALTLPAGARVRVLQVLPRVLRPWLHAMEVTVEGGPEGPSWALGGPFDCGSWVQPGGARPAAVGVCVSLPFDAAAVRVVLPFAKGFMHVDAHPPDSERGVDVPSATAVSMTAHDTYTVRASGMCACKTSAQACGRGARVLLATPDFSMAYNVTCITSTLLALFAGVLLNTLLRCVHGTT